MLLLFLRRLTLVLTFALGGGLTVAPLGAAAPSGPLPAIHIEDTRVEEGAPGETTFLTFVVRLTTPAEADVTVRYAVLPGSATADLDFLPSTGRLTFIRLGANELEHTLRIPVMGDDEIEPNETVLVQLSEPLHATLGRAQATGLILNDDGPTLSIRDATVTEGNSHPVPMVFDVRLSYPPSLPVSVAFFTADITATAGEDYERQAGLLTFEPGETLKSIIVPALPDGRNEAAETFLVQLTAPTAATLRRAQAIGTLLDDDVATLDVAEVSLVEGTGPVRIARFSVRLHPPSRNEVRVRFHTEPDTAAAGEDHLPVQGVLTFPPGLTELPVEVPVVADALDEADEAFFLVLSEATQAVLGTPRARGLIRDDDSPPFLRVEDIEVLECGADPPTARFPVTLSAPSGRDILVTYATAAGSATAGIDFLPLTHTVAIPRGQTTTVLEVPVVCDDLDEPDESFDLVLREVTHGFVAKGRARATLIDGSPPSLTVEDLALRETDGGVTQAVFRLRLSSPTLDTVSVRAVTRDGEAIAGEDYLPVETLVTFPPGTVLRTVAVAVLGDLTPEVDETFRLHLDAPTHARLGTSAATARILDDDRPVLTVDDASVVEGTGPPTVARLSVRLSRTSPLPVTLPFATVAGTAQAGEDFLPVRDVLVIPPGDLSAEIRIPLVADATPEANESLTLALDPPTHATLSRTSARLTLIDDDTLPVVDAADLRLSEATPAGAPEATVWFHLSSPSQEPIAVGYATASDSATSVEDYAPASGTLVFPPGSTRQPLPVTLANDHLVEPEERFRIVLRPPNQAILARTSVGVTIVDDDGAALAIEDASVLVATGEATQVSVVVHLSQPAAHSVSVTASTRDGTALAPEDYTPATRTVTFLPGQTAQPLTLTIPANTAGETEEYFFVELSQPLGATLSRSRATLRLLPAAPPNRPPSVRVTAPAEGDILPAEIPVQLTAEALDPEGTPVRVRLQIDGVALTEWVASPVRSVWTNAPPGLHVLRALASDADGLTSTSAPVAFTVLALPVLAIEDITVSEADGTARFPLSLSRTSAVPITVDVRLNPTVGSAVPDRDYRPRDSTILFAPGDVRRLFEVDLIDDLIHEPTKSFGAVLLHPTRATLDRASAIATLLDDDPLPQLRLAHARTLEGHAGSTSAVFVATLSGPSDLPASVRFTTRDLTARAGEDYDPVSGVLVLPPGQTHATLPVSVHGDDLVEPDEAFELTLTDPLHVRLETPTAIGTIVNDDQDTTPTNAPPQVGLIQPSPRTLLAPGDSLELEALASDVDGQVQRVEFYAGPFKIGEVTQPPYRFTWVAPPEGDHVLRARAIDDLAGIGDSAPVPIAVTHPCGRVVLLQNVADPEIDTLLDVFFAMGIPAEVVSREHAATLLVDAPDLVLWHDGGARGLSVHEVAILRQLADRGTALYFLGDALLESADDLSPADREAWLGLLALEPLSSDRPSGEATVTFEAGELPEDVLPIVRTGVSGGIGDFPCPLARHLGESRGQPGVTVLARAGRAEVLVATVAEAGGRDARRLTQTFRVTSGSDSQSLTERRRLFQNAVNWLLRCHHCANLNLVPLVSAWPESPRAGEPLTLSVQILHSGGCEALDVRLEGQLPGNTVVLDLQTPRGEASLAGNRVLFRLGRLPRGAEVTVNLTVVPSFGGPQETRFVVRSLNESAGSLGDNTVPWYTDVEGPPRLAWRRLSDHRPVLSLQGSPGTRPWIERAPALHGPWSPWTQILLETGDAEVPLDLDAHPGAAFFRARP